MRVRLSPALGLLALLCMAAPPASAADDIGVRQAWSRATPKGAQVAGGYLTIENHGEVADKLISAATTAAAKIEIHEMVMLDGIMMMRPVDGGLVIPPNESVTLAPGGSHLMFVGINAPFSEGEHIQAALMFENAGTIDVTFDVAGVGARGPRLLVASTGTPAPLAPPHAPAPDDFFTHICGTRLMANVTISPGHEGPVEVRVELEDGNEQPLGAQAVSVTLSDPDRNIAAVTVAAERVAADTWRAQMPAAAAGQWSLALGVKLADNDRIDIAAPILIER
jgi:copper(I)-binding protein